MKTGIRDVQLGLHLLEVEITTKCNLNCRHCYNRQFGKNLDMPLKEITSLIEFAAKNKVEKVVISGGEASLHSEFDSLSSYLRNDKPRVKVAVQSNGQLGRKNINSLRGFDIIHLSFEPDCRWRARTTPSRVILKEARKFLDAGIYTYLFATVHLGNLEKIDWMVEAANKQEIDIGFNLCVPEGNAASMVLSADQQITIIKKLHRLHKEGRILRFTSPLTAVLNDQRSPRYIGIKGGCTAGIAACSILPNGDVCPCPFFRIKAGNIHESDFREIWFNSKIFSALRDRKSFEEPCGSCDYLSYCGGCRARAMKVTGSLSGADVECLKGGLLK